MADEITTTPEADKPTPALNPVSQHLLDLSNSDDYLNGHYPDEPTLDHEILTEESAEDLSDE